MTMSGTKITTLLPFYYQNYYPKIGSNTGYLNKVVKVVIESYTPIVKEDRNLSMGGYIGKKLLLKYPPSTEPKNRAKKGSNEKLLPEIFRIFFMPTQENGAKKGSKMFDSNISTSKMGVKYYYE